MRIDLFRTAILLILSFALGTSALAQTTVTLQHGLNAYAGAADSFVFGDFPDQSQGANSLSLRSEANESMMARFKIFAAEGGPVPDGATITSATLSFYKFLGPDAVIKASRLLKNWSEAQATWNVAATGTPWTTPGALSAGNDYLATADGQASVGDAAANGCNVVGGGPYPAACFLNIDVTSGVQAFAANPASNFGWKLAQVSSSLPDNHKNFISKEEINYPTVFPKLTITYNVATASCDSGTSRPFDQAPISGAPIPVAAAGTTSIEAEHFNCGGEGQGYHDNTPGNQSTSTYRNPASVDVMDILTGGRTVQFFDTGEWMAYTISVATAGTYNVGIFAASNQVPAGQVAGQYKIQIDGVDATINVNVLSTGSWDSYAWTDAPAGITLSAGTHTLRLVSVQQSYRVDKLRVTAGTPPPPPPPPGDARACGGSALCINFENTVFNTPAQDSAGPKITTTTDGISRVWLVENKGNCSDPINPACGDRLRLAPGRGGGNGIRIATLDNDIDVPPGTTRERSEIHLDNGGIFNNQPDTGVVAGETQWWAHSLFIPLDSTLHLNDTNFLQFFPTQVRPDCNCSFSNFLLTVTQKGGAHLATDPIIFRAFTGGSSATRSGGFGATDNSHTQYRYTWTGISSPQIGACMYEGVQQGVWYDFVHRIKWSYANDGSHEIWMRKAGDPAPVKVLQVTGINTLYNGAYALLKIGVYHTALPGQITSVVHDRIRRSSLSGAAGAAAVAMPDFPVDLTPTPGNFSGCANVTIETSTQ